MRHLAVQAERITNEFDDLHARYATQHHRQEARPLAALLEQAAAAAHDLAAAANYAAEMIHRTDDRTA